MKPKSPYKRVTFKLRAPDAQTVCVAGSFNDWNPSSHPLSQDSRGTWKKTVSLAPGAYEYRFLRDQEWQDDPACQERCANPFGADNCILHI